MLTDAAKEKMDAEGIDATVAYLKTSDDLVGALDAFDELIRKAYWQDKNLDAVLTLGNAAIAMGVDDIAFSSDSDELADEYVIERKVKTIAYNIASFCWVGWDEPGIEISDDAIEAGLSAAKLNMKLAKILQVDELPMSRAYWMLAASELTQFNFKAAKQGFEIASEMAGSAGSETEQLLSTGFAYLTEILDPEVVDVSTQATQLNVIKMKLRFTQSGASFVDQLETAEAVCRKLVVSS
ncbi:hypothetical protein JD969_05635 [Planctomycetota bacterium]|nr:hypothetical protein JD969_05635 [Planctomycetota bacterium]